MVRDECVWPMHAKHSDWCRLAGIVQSLVEMIPNNCAIMFPDPLVPSGAPALTSSRPLFSDEDEDEEMLAPVSQSSFEAAPSGLASFRSMPLFSGGCFILAHGAQSGYHLLSCGDFCNEKHC